MDDSELKLPLHDLPENLWRRRSAAASPRCADRFRGVRDGKAWSRHDFWEFTVVLTGRGEWFHPDGSVVLEPETIVLAPPGLTHREAGPAALETIWIGFDAAVDELAGFSAIRTVADAGLTRRALRLWKLAALRQPGSGLELDGLLLELIGGWLRRLRSAPASGGETIHQVIEFMHENYAGEVDIPGLAHRLGWSESYFFRRFRALTGTTPVHYLNAIRVRQAMLHLSHSRLPLRAIAPLCGFRDPAYLSRVFKLHTGRSPRECRT